MNSTVAVPSITGNPVLDSALHSLIITVGASISALLIAWLGSKGIASPNLTLMIGGLVISLLSTIAAIVWAIVSKQHTVAALVDHSLTSAQTGLVSDAVKALATPSQKAAIAAAGK